MAFHTASGRLKAFTLIELLVVMTIIATLLTIAVPRYFHSIERSKEAVLRENLRLMRDAIDKYYGDTGKYPENLEVLVTQRYLRKIPDDPITGSNTTWSLIPSDNPDQPGVYDVRSGAQGVTTIGTAYADW